MTSFENAIAKLQAGERLQAEEIVARAVQEAAEAHGAQSAEVAAAEFDLARILIAVGDIMRAVEALRRAADVAGDGGEAARKAQLTYRMNLGELLTRVGKLDEAYAVLEASLRERAALYGVGSEGYAFGQEPLAVVLLRQWKLEPAEALVEQAMGTLWRARNRQVIPVAALRAAIRAAKYGAERPMLESFDLLPAELRGELVGACLERARHDLPQIALEVLTELRERLEDADEEDEGEGEGEGEGESEGEGKRSLRGWLPHVVGAISDAARAAGSHEARVGALEWLRAFFERQNDRAQELNAWQALALAWDEAAQPAKSEEHYRAALARCEGAPPAARSQILRNFGLSLAEKKRADEAEPLLRDAVAAAEAADNRDMLGRALVALGIFSQHAERLGDAEKALERALALLPPSHPDTLYARSHLTAIRERRSCGCGQMDGAFAEALDALVRPHLPEGLLRSIRIRSLETMTLDVDLARPPAEHERQLLDRVLNQAVAELREKIRNEGRG